VNKRWHSYEETFTNLYVFAVVRRIAIEPRGPFSLPAAAGFGFGPNEGRPPPFDGTLRLAFGVDGGGYAGVAIRQPQPDGPLELAIEGDGATAAVGAQVARILSLDHDGERWLEVGARDPVLGRLQRAHPGQRPVLFHSPYEGAAWSIISARRSARQAAPLRGALAEELGHVFDVAGERIAAFPQPEQLLTLEPRRGLDDVRVERLRGVAAAGLDGRLDAARLQRLGPERALEEVTALNGIGPFYGGLIVMRATGFADAVLSMQENKVLGHVARYYDLPAPPSPSEFAHLAEPWRPFRTWATVLLRLAGDRGTP
jgi:DNA-3-methyladenine glycosylase II